VRGANHWRTLSIDEARSGHAAASNSAVTAARLSQASILPHTHCPALFGWRHIKVTDRHTAVDYTHVLKDLADVHFANARTIVLVQDNLNIHSKASLYEAFPAAEATRLVERFEWHYTPKHDSWLDLAESELGVVPVPRPPDPRQTDPHRGNRRLGARPQRQPHQRQLVLLNIQRTRQTQASLSFNLNESGD
jgi:hypothetical protein